MAELGDDVPEWTDRPELRPDLARYWEAWNELHSRRRYEGGQPMPIQISEIEAWLQLWQIEEIEDRKEYYIFITAMEEEWLATNRQKIAKDIANEKAAQQKANQK